MTPHTQRFYDIVAEELRSRIIVDGLWVRSFSEAGGDDTNARAIYIGYRVEQLKAEDEALRATAFERAKAEARREKEHVARMKEEAKARRTRESEDPLDPETMRLLIAVLLGALVIFFVILFTDTPK